jgi:putative ATP-binding cassette transporter
LGFWEESAATNLRGWEVSEADVRRAGESGVFRDFHNLSYLEYAYIQLGRYRDAQRTVDIRIMVVPAKPYIPISTLRAAVTHPGVPGTYSDDDIRRALAHAHLGDLVSELNREEVWSQRLSSGEQQRVALARALLMKPDWLFLDESTSAVDERLEADLYATLVRRLPKTTIMSIGHRSAVVGLHQRHLEMCPERDHFTVRDSAKMVAAE